MRIPFETRLLRLADLSVSLPIISDIALVVLVSIKVSGSSMGTIFFTIQLENLTFAYSMILAAVAFAFKEALLVVFLPLGEAFLAFLAVVTWCWGVACLGSLR